jgi:hypothetical protein
MIPPEYEFRLTYHESKSTFEVECHAKNIICQSENYFK